jgi:hypothetical protein
MVGGAEASPMNALRVVVPSLACVSLCGQSVTLAAPVATSVSVQTAQGSWNNPIWPGPVSANSTVVAQVGLVDRAEWQWSAFAGTTVAGFVGSVRLDLANPGIASVQPGQLLFTLTAPAGGWIRLDCDITVQAPAGVPVPRVEIDIGANGSVELSQAGIVPQIINVPATGAPLPFGVTIDAGLATPGSLRAEVRITARPSNGVAANRMYAGCAFLELVRVAPTWSGGIEYQAVGANPLFPIVAVLGLHVQPTLLSGTGVPCLLFPTPDVLSFLPYSTVETLPIPPAVRPFDFWLQPVTAFGLETGWTWWVTAN